jgi:hypothetical protein
MGQTGISRFMEILWEHNGKTRRADIESHVLPYVEALGLDRAANFLTAFGGACVYIPKTARWNGASAVIAAIGADGVEALHKEFGSYIERVPLAKRFLIRHRRSQGMLVNEIARLLHTTDVAVRAALKSQTGGQA